MSSTKIINVLKDDQFEELLDIVRNTEASEVIFVLPKKTQAFKSEDQFLTLNKEAKNTDKSVAFLCSNPEVNELAKKYNFDILSTKTEKLKDKEVLISRSNPKDLEEIRAKSIAIPVGLGSTRWVAVKNDDSNYNSETNERPEEELEEESLTEEEVEHKEEEEEEEAEVTEDEPPYGTEVDESDNPIYDEGGEKIGEQIISGRSTDFPIFTASAKTRGMSDIVRPSSNKNLGVIQKDKGSVQVKTRRVEENAIPDLSWNTEQSDNIWADISKSHPPAGGFKSSFFSKFKVFEKPLGKRARTQPGLHKKRFGVDPGNLVKNKTGVLLLILFVLVLVVIIYTTTGSAKIEIKPRSQNLDIQLKVTMSPNFSSVDSSFNRIPGQLFIISKSVSDEFNATTEKDAIQKSRGTITIYNEYGTSPQPLISTTRFELIQEGKGSGLVFRTLKSVIIPGMKVENGIITPGKIDVEVIADKAGQVYNVSPGNFGIVAWQEKGDTARYEKIYGKSTSSMHGGILGKAKVVSEFDYNNAKNQLTDRIKNNINESLKSQSADLELFDSIKPKIDSVESTAEIDNAADTFTMTLNGSITTMGFKKSDLISLLSQYVDRVNNLMIVPEKLELSYGDTVINLVNNTINVVVIMGGNVYDKIDKADIAVGLMGKNEAQIKDYLGSIKNIDSAKVILSPFWVKKVPKNKDKIDISLTF